MKIVHDPTIKRITGLSEMRISSTFYCLHGFAAEVRNCAANENSSRIVFASGDPPRRRSCKPFARQVNIFQTMAVSDYGDI